MGSKKTKSTTNQTTSSNAQANPWAPAEPGFNQLATGAQNAAAASQAVPAFTGDLFARPNAVQEGANTSALGVANWAGEGATQLHQLGLDTIAGKFLDSANNPYLQSAITASINPLREQLTQTVHQIGDRAQQSGAYGGDRQGVTEGTAVRGFNQDAMNLAAQMNYGNYATERQNQINAPSLLQAATAIGLQPSQIMADVGTQQQKWQQSILDEALQKHQMAIDAPWAGLDRLAQVMSIFSPYASQSGTSTTTGTTTQKAPGGGIGGALGGAAAGSAFGPWGAAIGGLAGLFG